jgi:hypothetical protein
MKDDVNFHQVDKEQEETTNDLDEIYENMFITNDKNTIVKDNHSNSNKSL